jgi:hypothetical protein
MAQVPLADAGRGVAVLFEVLGQGLLRQRQLHRDLRMQELLRFGIGPAGEERRDVQPGRVLAGHQRGSRRRADRLGAVGRRKAKALAGQPVEIGRRLIHPPIAREVIDSQVVG